MSHHGNTENNLLLFACLVLINFKQLSVVPEKYLLWCKRKAGTHKLGERADNTPNLSVSSHSDECWN